MIARTSNQMILRLALAGLAALLLVLIQTGMFDGFATALGGTQIEVDNIGYLTDARDAAANDFLILSEIFAVLEVIASADVGFDFFVSASVQVGQALAGLSTAIENALLVSAAAAASAEALLAISSIAQFLSQPLLCVALALLAAYFILSAFHRVHTVSRTVRSMTEIVSVLFLVVHLIVPYSIHLSGWIATNAVASLHEESRSRLQSLHGDITDHTIIADGFDSWSKDDQVKAGFERVSKNVTHKIDAVGLYSVRQFTSAVLLGIVLPLGLLAVFYLGAQRMVRFAAAALAADWAAAKSSGDQEGS